MTGEIGGSEEGGSDTTRSAPQAAPSSVPSSATGRWLDEVSRWMGVALGVAGLAMVICVATGLQAAAVVLGAVAACGLVQRAGAIAIKRRCRGAWRRFYVVLLWCMVGRMAFSLLLVIGYLVAGGPQAVLFALVYAASYVVLGGLEAWALVATTCEARRLAS